MRVDDLTVSANYVGRTRCTPDWHMTPATTRAWKDLALWLLIEGCGEVDAPDGTHALSPGACLFLRGGESYTFRPDSHRLFTHYYAHFDYLDEQGKPYPVSELTLPPLLRILDSPELMIALFRRCIYAMKRQNRARCSRWISTMLMEVADTDALSKASPSVEAQWLAKLCERIRQNPEESYSVEQLAEEAGYGRVHFGRLFRRHTGTTPRQFITEARMHKARALLRDTAQGIEAIASALGYSDVFYFSKHFKEHHGISPMRYRRR